MKGHSQDYKYMMEEYRKAKNSRGVTNKMSQLSGQVAITYLFQAEYDENRLVCQNKKEGEIHSRVDCGQKDNIYSRLQDAMREVTKKDGINVNTENLIQQRLEKKEL